MFNKEFFKYLFRLYILALGVFLILRLSFLFFHFKEIIPLSSSLFLKSILIGSLFDSVVVSSLIVFLIILTLIIQLIHKSKTYITTFVFSNIILGIFFFINIVDIFYFEQYGTRINSLISEAGNNTNIIIVTIWKMYPVIWTVIFFIILQFIFYKIHKKIFSIFLQNVNLIINKSKKWPFYFFATFFGLSFLYYGPPLWSISEFSSSSVLNQGSMNGVYCLCKSFQHNYVYKYDIPTYHFSDDSIALSVFQKSILHQNDSFIRKDFPSLRYMKQQDSIFFNKKDIVIILLESFGSKYIGCLNNGVGYSPSFDSISKSGILFSNFKSNGPRTQNGIISTISGFPAILGSNLQRRKGINEFQTLSNILLANGYITNFIHNGHISYDDIDKFLKQGGFLNQIDVHDFASWRVKNEWGVSDEDLYDKAYNLIWDSNNKPSLSVLLTMSNHPPFEIPLEFKKTHPEINIMTPQLAAFYYSDFALGQFIYKCMSNPKYSNTLFYILADHSENYQSSDNELNLFEIPFLILNSKQQNGICSKVASQCDIPSTILSEINYKGRYHFIGQNILCSDYNSFAFMRNYNNDVYYSEANYILKYNLETLKSKLFLKDGKTLQELNNYTYSETQSRMNKFIESYIQSLSIIFKRGGYRFDLKK